MVSGMLGKTPARHDPRTLRMSKYLTGPIANVLSDEDWSRGAVKWRMFRNDLLGCCTRAAQGHAVQTWLKATGSQDAPPDDAAIVEAYSRASGYVPGDPSTDQGCNMLDALTDWRKNPLGGHRIHSFVKLSAGDRSHLMAAIQMFGGVYVGAQLPRACQDRDVWIAAARTSRDGEYAPGSWGGHCFWSPGYTPAGVLIVSWGQLVCCSWQWWLDYVDEAYAVLGAKWADEGRPAPSGFDLATLRADLAMLDAA